MTTYSDSEPLKVPDLGDDQVVARIVAATLEMWSSGDDCPDVEDLTDAELALSRRAFDELEELIFDFVNKNAKAIIAQANDPEFR